MKRPIFAAFIVTAMMAVGVMSQRRPQPGGPRPTPTPLPKPAATPVANSAAVPDSRIALIDTSIFGDEKNGIYRYVDAAKSVEAEFKTRSDEVQNLQNRLNALANEIQTLSKAPVVDQKTIQAKQQQGQTLQAEDRKSTRLNSSHQIISYAVFCLKKK